MVLPTSHTSSNNDLKERDDVSSSSDSDVEEDYDGGKCLPVHWGPPDDASEVSADTEPDGENEEDILLSLASRGRSGKTKQEMKSSTIREKRKANQKKQVRRSPKRRKVSGS